MRHLQLIVAGAAGLGLVGLAMLVATRPGTPPRARPKSTSSDVVSPAEIDALNARVRQLEGRQFRAPSPMDAGNFAPVQPDTATPEPTERTPLIAQEIESVHAAFMAEHNDPTWSSQATRAFRADLERIAERARFKLVSLECRMSICRSEVEWTSYSEAVVNWQSILHADYENACARRVDVPEPSSTDEEGQVNLPARGTAYFDCTEARAEGLSR